MYRIYYNLTTDWPQCWSVDEGDQTSEINVIGVVFDGVEVHSRVVPREVTGDPKTQPRAYFAVDRAFMQVRGGVAYFRKVD